MIHIGYPRLDAEQQGGGKKKKKGCCGPRRRATISSSSRLGRVLRPRAGAFCRGGIFAPVRFLFATATSCAPHDTGDLDLARLRPDQVDRTDHDRWLGVRHRATGSRCPSRFSCEPRRRGVLPTPHGLFVISRTVVATCRRYTLHQSCLSVCLCL